MIMIGTAVLVAAILLINRRNLAYAGVLVWALFGIRASAIASGEPTLAAFAVGAAVIITGLAALGYYRTRSQKEQPADQLTTASQAV
ncbi:MAG: hypothetical protein KDE48_03575, partial [Anaerolineales bacterium]|nr:hypothetical protein [Anaerolineales bacterium]